MAATLGRTSDFLSEADLLRFRGLTNLLRATNDIDDRTQQGGHGFICSRRKVVAVRSAGKNGKLIQILTDPDRDDDETSENSPEIDDGGDAGVGHVYYMADSDPETDKNNGNKKKGIENRVAPLLVEIIAEPAEPMDSVGAWLLKHTTGTKRKAPKTSITLDKHGSMLVSLITATHEASDSDLVEKSTRLHNYVLLASIAKIHGRFIRGTAKHKRNLWEFLTKQSTDFHTAPGIAKDIPSNTKGMKIPGRILKNIFDSLVKSKTDLAPELKPWLGRYDGFEYTNDTRHVFQALLSGLLVAVQAALLNLLNKKHERLMEKGEGKLSEEQVANAAQELDKYAAIASLRLRLLSALLVQARTVVQAHLLYLKDVFAITSIKNRENQRRELISSPPSYSADALSSDRSGQPSSKPGPYQPSSLDCDLGDLGNGLERTAISKTGAYTAEFEEIDSAGIQNNWDLAALKYLDLCCLHTKAVNSVGKTSGDLHDKTTREFLVATRFEYVRCFQDEADSNMMSMRNVMETLKLPSGAGIGPCNVARLKAFIQEHEQTWEGKNVISDTKWEDEKSFDGNFHCETLMLSLQLLCNTQAARDEVSSDEDSENLYLRLPSKDIVNRFADSTEVFPVSKRCCPACHALMEYFIDSTWKRFPYPGHHENWCTAALPPWIPRKAGMAVIEAAETKLVERVKKLSYSTPLSDSSTGKSPITSDELMGFEDYHFDAIPTPKDWSKDPGEKRLAERVRQLDDDTPSPQSSTGTSPIVSYREVHDLEDSDSEDSPTPKDWSKDPGEKRKRGESDEESDAGRSSSPTKRRQEM